jgi:hypothetical protein
MQVLQLEPLARRLVLSMAPIRPFQQPFAGVIVVTRPRGHRDRDGRFSGSGGGLSVGWIEFAMGKGKRGKEELEKMHES